MDWTAWMDRWDRQQEGYMGNREERFGIIADVVAESCGRSPRVLDLCCGPGSLSRRVLDRIPDARVTAIDVDPVLQLLGKKAYGDADGRLTWVNHNLSDPAWEQIVAEHGPFDAAVSTTALHWLSAATLTNVYESVWRLLAAGGVLVNGDHLFEDHTKTRLRALGRALRVTAADEREQYQAWWKALQAEAADDAELAAAFDARSFAGAGHHDEDAPVFAFHDAALRHAGFAEVGTIWQHGDDRVLVALRD